MSIEIQEIPTPQISVIVPVAVGRGRLDLLLTWLPKALDLDFQIVVVLDEFKRSDENALPALHLLARHPNLTIRNGKYGSPGLARNAGLEVAVGKWLFFWDADDLPNVKNAKLMVDEAERSKASFAVGSFEWKFQKPNYHTKLFLLEESQKNNLTAIGINPGLWRFAFQRNLISHSFTDIQMGEDQIFLLQNTDFSQNYLAFPEIIYCYTTGNSFQQTSNPKFIIDLSRSIMLTSRLIRELISPSQKYLARVFLLRQLVSGLTHGTLKSRFRIFLKALVAAKNLGLPNTFLIGIDALRIIGSQRIFMKDSRVVLPLTGGLGNQLFQLAAALSIAKGGKVLLDQSIGKPRINELGLPELVSFELPNTVELSPKKSSNFLMSRVSGLMLRSGLNPRHIENVSVARGILNFFWRLTTLFSFGINLKPLSGSGVGYFEIPQSSHRKLIYGYFQSYRWPNSVKVQLLAIKPKSKPLALINLESLSQIEKPLVVHVRLGDYRNEPNFGLLDQDYFRNATEELWSTQNFRKIWLFSDEPSEAIKYFSPELLPEIRVVSDFQDSASLTLESMRLGHGYVISNSTFSWWGAYLTHNADAPVIAPTPWFSTLEDPIDLVPPAWYRRSS